jgi:hypothetical protein
MGVDLAQELAGETLSVQIAIWKGLQKFNELPSKDDGMVLRVLHRFGMRPRRKRLLVPVDSDEVLYFALALTTYSIFRWGSGDPSMLSDKVVLKVLKTANPSSQAFKQAVQHYQARHAEYAQVLPSLFNEETSDRERFFTGIAIARNITGKEGQALVGTYLTAASTTAVGALKDVIKSAGEQKADDLSE